MGGLKKNNLIHFILSVCFVTLLYAAVAVVSGIFLRSVDAGRVRIIMSEVMRDAVSGTVNRRTDLTYAVISTQGKVGFSTMTEYLSGDSVDLFELTAIDGKKSGTSYLYACPMTADGNFKGMLLLRVEASSVLRINILAAAALCIGTVLYLLTLILSLTRFLKFRREIVAPVRMLNDFADNLLKGDYAQKLKYDSVDELGRLCHSCEALRDELKCGNEREENLKNQEKFLLACISHDLKTPLAVISGNAETIRDSIGDSRASAKAILNKCGHLSKLIDDILEQTKTEINELSVDLQETYSKEFFERELSEMGNIAADKNISFEYSQIPDVLLCIDKNRICQALSNLVGNSIKYTQKGGFIRIDLSVRGKYFTVAVIDNGSGIKAGDLPFIFNKFYRGEKARTLSEPGSGLGLSIVKYIVEKHGGSIECDSIYGHGTTMQFFLPLG